MKILSGFVDRFVGTPFARAFVLVQMLMLWAFVALVLAIVSPAARAAGLTADQVGPFAVAVGVAILSGATYVFQAIVNRVKSNLPMKVWMVLLPVFATGLGVVATWLQVLPLPADWSELAQFVVSTLVALFGSWVHDQQLWLDQEGQETGEGGAA